MKKITFIICISLISYTGLVIQHSSAEEINQEKVPQITRNPFTNVPYGSSRKYDTGIQKDSIENTVKNMKVKGILVGKDYSMAIVGHRIVKTGDVIDELTVSEITRKGVSLMYEDRVFHVFME